MAHPSPRLDRQSKTRELHRLAMLQRQTQQETQVAE